MYFIACLSYIENVNVYVCVGKMGIKWPDASVMTNVVR